MKFIDLTSKRFGRLLAIKRQPNRKTKVVWLCQCDCGNTSEVISQGLISLKTQSCGCLNIEILKKRFEVGRELTSQLFGKWTVVSKATSIIKQGYPRRMWLCRCVCGTERPVEENQLIRGDSTSCGCTRNIKHGMSKTSEYSIWASMRDRCLNPGNEAWNNYGGRGITVSKEFDTFIGFYNIVGRKPDNKSLDRIDNNKGYEPGNIKWSTQTEQTSNTRRNKYITFENKTMTASAWARELGVSPSCLYWRMKYGGKSGEEAVAMGKIR